MKPESARTLLWLAGIVLALGLMIASPSGAIACFALAALSALVPAIRGPGRLRIVALLLLIAGLAMSAITYPDFSSEQDRYRQRVQERNATTMQGGQKP